MGEVTNITERAALLAMAQRAASTLNQSIAGKPFEMAIETNVASLSGFPGVIDALLADVSQCGGIDCIGRAIDDIKPWVTRDRLEGAEQRATRYEATLRGIAKAVRDERSELDILIDWQGTAQALAGAARTALANVPDETPVIRGRRS